MKRNYLILAILGLSAVSAAAQSSRNSSSSSQSSNQKLVSDVVTTAWEATEPLGLREPVAVDTLELNYYKSSIPSTISPAYACTGNLGTEGKNMIFMDQAPISQFFLQDAMRAWTPWLERHVFFNSAWPHTNVEWNTAGGRDNSQDRLQAIFTGNINKESQIGANIDYLYSKGCYTDQSTKHTNWGLSGSHLGQRYEFQGSWYHYNMLNKENGGITDDLYITDPAQLQGGVTTINPQSIPTNLSDATNRFVGEELFLNNRYKFGYWHEERDSVDTDSVVSRNFVAASSVFWNLNYKKARHRFLDKNPNDNDSFWENTYLSRGTTQDITKYSTVANTVGISMIEGFHKYAKFGVAAYLTYEMRRFTQTADTLDRSNPAEAGLTPFPEGVDGIAHKGSQNLAWVGAEISKQKGSILTYNATAEIGVLGDAIGELKIRGKVSTRIPMFGDTVAVSAHGSLYNVAPPYLINNYLSNHFVWRNDFSKEQKFCVGGAVHIPWTETTLSIGTESLKNLIYFNDKGLPAQHGSMVQVFSASLRQNFKVGILHWDNSITYQTSTDEYVLPLPKLAVYSNLYLKCHIATLSLQLGVDCDYYTSYYAPAYQPATATFHNQHEIKCGNYPFMTAYANMKLGRTRFYVMMTHVNQGLFGTPNYFSSPHYPLNPRRFQMGLSVDFWD